jgi:hypothetical protein
MQSESGGAAQPSLFHELAKLTNRQSQKKAATHSFPAAPERNEHCFGLV